MPFKRFRTFAGPVLLIGVGIWLLSGCIFIPAFNKPLEGEPPVKKVGDERSNKPIRTRATTREQVLSILGRPSASSDDSRVLAYGWGVRNGYWIWPLCFMGSKQDGTRTLVLRFDDTDTLVSFEVIAEDGNPFIGGVDPVIAAEWAVQEATRPRETLPESRAATRRKQ